MNEELFVKVKPGLSSFAKEPEKATESIRSLLDQAVDIIPKDQHQVTRLTLKATAGLRMLSDQIANKILDNVLNSVFVLFCIFLLLFNLNKQLTSLVLSTQRTH